MSSKYFENRSCEHYPCHNSKAVNCLFCFCPLYENKNCPGNPTFLKNGVKDCSLCTFPHKEENYEIIMEYLKRSPR